MAWTIWEREIFAAVEVLHHFVSVLGGMFVIFHTDHLNSTVMANCLKQPEHILRMILKVETSCHACWRFVPGSANVVGDAASRIPPERDAMREAIETKSLGEAFEAAGDSVLSMVDDVDGVLRLLREEGDLEDVRSETYKNYSEMEISASLLRTTMSSDTAEARVEQQLLNFKQSGADFRTNASVAKDFGDVPTPALWDDARS